ncbi:MAG: histone deacetylase [Anaerolineales bacterium]|nr:histone deacetylase [Anaerolineales bacterium]
MKTVFTFVPSQNHEYPEHPERPGRLEVLEPKLGTFAAERMESTRATVEEVARVHKPELIRAIEEVCQQGPGIIDHAPTYVTHTSYEDAMLAAGGVMTCTRMVVRGEAKNAFAIVRPPGHHAEPYRSMGFCIFNNIAVAAQDALSNGMERVMVIDYDAHHGNGTQAAFMNDERTGFISTHQWGIYPGTGWFEDAPHARKRIANVPLHARAGDETFSLIGDEIFKPMVEAFRPQMLLISAGFDAHWNDPITSLGLSTQGYFNISKKLVELAEEHCDGKIVFVLEGGYDPRNVANGVDAVFGALTSHPFKNEANDPSPHKEPDHGSRIAEIRKWQGFES